MLNKVLALIIVFGFVVADPIQERTFSSSNNVVYLEHPSYELAARPDVSSFIDAICSLIIGYKISALSVAVSAIEWFVSNFFVVLIGAATALGFCKISGVCSLNYEEYIPVTHLQGLVTAENIHSAEKFLVTAVEKYAEKRKRST